MPGSPGGKERIMARKRGARPGDAKHASRARADGTPSAITSRFALLRQEQIVAARRLAAVEAECDTPPPRKCRIAAARDRRSPFVYHPPRDRW
jgi:hypothetical protein